MNTELLPATHTKEEYDLVPDGYIHFKRIDPDTGELKIIHKKPGAFAKRSQQEKKFVKEFNEETGQDVVTQTTKTIARDPAATLAQYEADGWDRCNRDGTITLNRDGSPMRTAAELQAEEEATAQAKAVAQAEEEADFRIKLAIKGDLVLKDEEFADLGSDQLRQYSIAHFGEKPGWSNWNKAKLLKFVIETQAAKSAKDKD